eukprot:jgi/Galph1/2132/GphlegSOOS_G821.1
MSSGTELSNKSNRSFDKVSALESLAEFCEYPLPHDYSENTDDILRNIRQLVGTWNKQKKSIKFLALKNYKKPVLVSISTLLGRKRSGTKATLVEEIICGLYDFSSVHSSVSSFIEKTSLTQPTKTHNSLPSVRVICGEVLYLHPNTQTTGIVFGEVERAVILHPFLDIENQFMKPVGPPLNEGKGLAWFSSVALEIGQKVVTIYFSVPNEFSGASIILRQVEKCLKVDLSIPLSSWQNEWPFPVSSFVNGYAVKLKTATRYTNGKVFGVDGATDITNWIRKDGSPNKVSISRPATATAVHPSNAEYILFVQPAYIDDDSSIICDISGKSWSMFVQRLQNISKLSKIDSTCSKSELLKMYLKEFMEAEEVELEQIQISLRCPLSLAGMSYPALGIHCQHIQCFDLNSFLSFTRNNLRFRCPICSSILNLSDLMVCPFTLDVLWAFPDAKALNIFHDGSFEVVREESGMIGEEKINRKEEQTVQLQRNMEDKQGHSDSNHGYGGARSESIVIDLTEDD